MKFLNVLASVAFFSIVGVSIAYVIFRLAYVINARLGVDHVAITLFLPYVVSFGVGIYAARKFYLFLDKKERNIQLLISVPLVLLLAGASFADWFLVKKPEDPLLHLYIEEDKIRIGDTTIDDKDLSQTLKSVIEKNNLKDAGLIVINIDKHSSAIKFNESISAIKENRLPYTVFEN